MALRRTCALLLSALLLASACGKDEAPAEGLGGSSDEAAGGSVGGLPAIALPTAPALAPATTPDLTEEGLVERVAAALERRDLAALQATAAPELAADLHRLHQADPPTFWRRGQQWVVNVRSGFTVTHRQDTSADSWRVLLKFGNGQEETVTFTRTEGRLVFEAL